MPNRPPRIIQVPKKDTGRGVVFADEGLPNAYIFDDDVDLLSLLLYQVNGAAVAFWLPANAYAIVTIFKREDPLAKPRYYANYEVFNCDKLYVKPVEIADLGLTAGRQVQFVNRENEYEIECPEDSGTYITKNCPRGLHGVCGPGGVVACEIDVPPLEFLD